MSNKHNVVIVGATGLVGKELIEALERRRFPIASLRLFASMNSAGEHLPYFDDEIKVEPIRSDYYRDSDVVFFATHPLVSRDLAEDAARAGALVIDASNAFRLDPAVPLVVTEVNPETLALARDGKRIVASPSAAATALALALAPLARRFGVARLVTTAIYGTTTAGRLGFEEHQYQTINVFNQQELTIERFPRQTAFNVFPYVGGFGQDADLGLERELMDELPRVLGGPLPVAVTAVQAPLFCGVGLAANVELSAGATLAEVRETLGLAAGVTLMDEPAEEVFPDTLLAMDHDEVLLGRLREDRSRPGCFSFWLSADNLRKGSALNMVEIAELWFK
jgi:aspartate-semialdehyde dehydrogenase